MVVPGGLVYRLLLATHGGPGGYEEHMRARTPQVPVDGMTALEMTPRGIYISHPFTPWKTPSSEQPPVIVDCN